MVSFGCACKERLSGLKGAPEPATAQELAITSQYLAGFSQHFLVAHCTSQHFREASRHFRIAHSTSEKLAGLPEQLTIAY